MAGTDELMARLAQLEQGYYGDKEAARPSCEVHLRLVWICNSEVE